MWGNPTEQAQRKGSVVRLQCNAKHIVLHMGGAAKRRFFRAGSKEARFSPRLFRLLFHPARLGKIGRIVAPPPRT
jgi:hypothetical protein